MVLNSLEKKKSNERDGEWQCCFRNTRKCMKMSRDLKWKKGASQAGLWRLRIPGKGLEITKPHCEQGHSGCLWETVFGWSRLREGTVTERCSDQFPEAIGQDKGFRVVFCVRTTNLWRKRKGEIGADLHLQRITSPMIRNTWRGAGMEAGRPVRRLSWWSELDVMRFGTRVAVVQVGRSR